MKLYLGVTDTTWFNTLAKQQPPPPEINFWKPGASRFAALVPGSPLVFKLKAPINKVGGVGFFLSYNIEPMRKAWDSFTIGNGRQSYEDFQKAIAQFAGRQVHPTTPVGCVLLENPVFFEQQDWIDLPKSWKPNIVSGKGYDMSTGEGALLWSRIDALLQADRGLCAARPSLIVPDVFGKEYLRKSRPGQAGFRAGLTLAYEGRCAITGENIAPVLQAAHIQPVSQMGTNEITNGLLLRSDMHTLYDDGLIGVTPDYKIVISDQIKDQYVNGKIYYRWHGHQLTKIPKDNDLQPDRERLEWHMSEVYNRV